MSEGAGVLALPSRPAWPRALLIAAAALAAAALIVWLAILLSGAGAAPKPPPRSPFGGLPRDAAPSGGAFAMWLASMQSQFYRMLTAALAAMRDGSAGAFGLAWIGFLYGVFHASGPGHGKAVVAGYIIANEQALSRGIAVAFAAAALQAAVAIALVGIASLILGATARQMSATTNLIEIASFAAMAALGAWLLWAKSRRFAALLSPSAATPPPAAENCGHMHAPPPELLAGRFSARAFFATVVAAGMRPCSGAIILLVFALAQGMFLGGVYGVVAMALGTAIATSALAALAVFFKQAALRFASGRGRGGIYFLAAGETLAAAFIFVIGAALAFGFWAAGAG